MVADSSGAYQWCWNFEKLWLSMIWSKGEKEKGPHSYESVGNGLIIIRILGN